MPILYQKLDLNKRKSFNIYASSGSAKTAESLISKKEIINFILIKMKSQQNLVMLLIIINNCREIFCKCDSFLQWALKDIPPYCSSKGSAQVDLIV